MVLEPGLEKMFISLQAGQNFPPAGQISLQCKMVSLMYHIELDIEHSWSPIQNLILFILNLSRCKQNLYHSCHCAKCFVSEEYSTIGLTLCIHACSFLSSALLLAAY